jgi:hypothetical protein
MAVRKKNLLVRNIKIYPLDLDMSKRCFVRFYVATGVKCRIGVAKKFNTLELRRKEADRIVNDLKKNGFTHQTEKEENKANKQIELLFELLENKTKLSPKTLAAYAAHIRALNVFCAKNKILDITPRIAARQN